jgi:hypothetical protein
MEQNYFTELNGIDVSSKTEKKNGLTYLSWAWAWAELKKRHPDAIYTIYENADGLFYHTDGKTAWVKTGVTVNGIEHIEYLPVMDYKNKSIPAESVTSFDVNKAIQRSLTKAVARHGLGLYVYAGEDLPEDAERAEKEAEYEKRKKEKVSAAHAKALEASCEKLDVNVEKLLEGFGVKAFSELTQDQANKISVMLNKAEDKNAKVS